MCIRDSFVQTQQIYDLEQEKRYIDKMSEFDVPIMLGLIPLKSFKMATYLHEKVPGINLTQEILDRMEKGGKEAGTEIAIETLEQIKKIAAGVHIMPVSYTHLDVYKRQLIFLALDTYI